MPQKLRIGIVGCGVTGLAAAIFLKRDGHHVSLFEQNDAPKPAGAGLLLQPTGLAALRELGLAEKIIARGMKVERLLGKTTKGRTVIDVSYRELSPACFGLGIHRGTLYEALLEEVMAQDIPIMGNCRIVDATANISPAWAVDATGVKYGPFDLIVDAGGIKSPLRDKYARVRLNRPYPFGALWGVVKYPGEDKFARHLLQQRYHGTQIMIGALPLGLMPGPEKQECMAFFWSLPRSAYAPWKYEALDTWQEKVIKLWPEMEPLVTQFKKHDDLTLALYSDIILHEYHAGPIVFIGDAAHTTSPQLGQGANLGMMDAMVLAECLRNHENSYEALREFGRKRHAHVKFYQWASRMLTPVFQSSLTPLGWLRDMLGGPACKVPFLRNYMVNMLAGIKTGVFSGLQEKDWNSPAQGN